MKLLMSSHRHWGEASMLMENTGESGEGNDCLMEECGYQKKAEEGHITYKTMKYQLTPIWNKSNSADTFSSSFIMLHNF